MLMTGTIKIIQMMMNGTETFYPVIAKRRMKNEGGFMRITFNYANGQ